MNPTLRIRLGLVGLATLFASPVAAWEHNGLIWPAERFPLPIVLQPTAPRDTDLETLESIVITSLDTWNNVSCSYAELEYAGQGELPIAIDGDQVLAWTSNRDEWIYGSATAGATIIDVMTGVPRVDIFFNDVTFRWVVGANTFVLPGHRWGADNPVDVDPASVITHEVGHLLGLSHPNPEIEGSQPDALATMVFALLPNAQQSSLAADDKLGLCARYPVDATDECTNNGDCGDGSYCRDVEPEGAAAMRMCDEVRSTWGDDCWILNYNCEGICLFLSADYVDGVCTTYCEVDGDCPADWECSPVEASGGATVEICLPEGTVPADDVGAGQNDSGLPTIVEDPPDAAPVDATDGPDGQDASSADSGGDDALQDAASPPESNGTESSGKRGCSSAHGAGGLWLAFVAALGWRRRRWV